jgi:uncharacterized NAD(P)/FAD-binding protein YdhS
VLLILNLLYCILCFDQGCSKLLDQKKQDKLQWLQDQSEINRDILNNIRREASRHFKNKKREYLKYKINEVASNTKNKNTETYIEKQMSLKRITNLEVT